MNQLFTAVGEVTVTTLTEQGHNSRVCKFSHVVQAETSDEACDKVIDYYSDKSDCYDSFGVDSIEIFDFIA